MSLNVNDVLRLASGKSISTMMVHLHNITEVPWDYSVYFVSVLSDSGNMMHARAHSRNWEDQKSPIRPSQFKIYVSCLRREIQPFTPFPSLPPILSQKNGKIRPYCSTSSYFCSFHFLSHALVSISFQFTRLHFFLI